MGFLLLSKGNIPGPHDFASVSGLASHSGCLGPHEFTLVSPLSPTLGALGLVSLHLSPPCLSRALGALGRMSLHLSPPCLSLWVPWAAWVYTCLPLVSHSGCLGPREFTLVSPLSLTSLGPHEFTLVSPLSPTLCALGRVSLHLSPPCLSRALGALGRMGLHLSPTCLPLWVPWAA